MRPIGSTGLYRVVGIEDNFLKRVSVFDRSERFASNTDNDEIPSSFESNDLIIPLQGIPLLSVYRRIYRFVRIRCKYLTISLLKDYHSVKY